MAKSKIHFRGDPLDSDIIWVSKKGRAPSASGCRHALQKRYPSAAGFKLMNTDHTLMVVVFYGPLQAGAEQFIDRAAEEKA